MRLVYIIIFVVCLFSSSCAHQEYGFYGAGPHTRSQNIAADYTIKHRYLFFGLMQKNQLDIVDRCKRGDNVVKINTFQSLSDSLWSAFTLFIYAPRTTMIYCRY